MDKLFKKRTLSTSTSSSRSRGKNNTAPTRRNDLNGNSGRQKVTSNVPPSLDVEIRNSLILPGLSQRFSVLLPTLSSAPETSVRSLLALQRTRADGPCLTLEEEDLLLAEIRQAAAEASSHDHDVNEQQLGWDGRRPAFDRGYSDGTFVSSLSTSISSPSVLAAESTGVSPSPSSEGQLSAQAAASASASGLSSPNAPLSTSGSYTSFNTFGPPTPGDVTGGTAGLGAGTVRTRSYGFGSSTMRDVEYIRSVKKSASKPTALNVDPDSPHDVDPSSASATRFPSSSKHPHIPNISPERANAYFTYSRQQTDSPLGSDRTTTPTPSSILTSTSSSLVQSRHGRSPSASATLQTPLSYATRSPPAAVPLATASDPTSSEGRQQRQLRRQSLLTGISPTQAKRISQALVAIERQLGREIPLVIEEWPGDDDDDNDDDGEEILEFPTNGNGTAVQDVDVVRRPSVTSATSSVFPFSLSPTSSSHTATGKSALSETSPPPKVPSIPSSPRSHNLQAHIAPRSSPADHRAPSPPPPPPPRSPPADHRDTPTKRGSKGHEQNSLVSMENQPGDSNGQSYLIDSIYSAYYSDNDEFDYESFPQPALTPCRPQPVRTVTVSSVVSSGSSMSPVPYYVPGQPRPVGSMHRSVPSTSSRSNTPLPTPQSPHLLFESSSTRSGSSPSPVPPRPPPVAHTAIAPKSALLGRSQSVNQASYSSHPNSRSITPTQGSFDHVPAPGVLASRHRVSKSVETVSAWRTSSSLALYSSQPIVPQSIIDETDEEDDTYSYAPSSQALPTGYGDTPASSPLTKAVGSPTKTLRRIDSDDSISSDYCALETDATWNTVFVSAPVHHESQLGDSFWASDDKDVAAYECDLLHRMTGVGKEELFIMQNRLVAMAKKEREAMRMMPSRSLHSNKSSIHDPSSSPRPPPRAQSPPTSWRSRPDHHHGPSQPPSPVVGPPLAIAPLAIASTPLPPVPQTQANGKDLPPPPTEDIESGAGAVAGPDETSPVRARRRLDEDPDVRRDYEERVAAATALLQRGPSLSGRKRSMSRKGPKVISSPTLVSSSTKLPATPITPGKPDKPVIAHSGGDIEPAIAHALEKTSGPGRKMSLKWKKLAGFRKNPSFSGTDPTSLPTVSTPPSNSTTTATGSLSSRKQLDAPITLKAAAAVGSSAPADLTAFRFPPGPSPHDSTPMTTYIPTPTSAPAKTAMTYKTPPLTSDSTVVVSPLPKVPTRAHSGRVAVVQAPSNFPLPSSPPIL